VGDDWLVLATQPATGEEEMDEIYNSLAQFAESFNGTYDGWERPADFEDENVN
jgi:regulator of RNase E activity RraB